MEGGMRLQQTGRKEGGGRRHDRGQEEREWGMRLQQTGGRGGGGSDEGKGEEKRAPSGRMREEETQQRHDQRTVDTSDWLTATETMASSDGRGQKPEKMEAGLPPARGRRRQSRCRCCGRGCWLCPAARWPASCSAAARQTDAAEGGGRCQQRRRWREETGQRSNTACMTRHHYKIQCVCAFYFEIKSTVIMHFFFLFCFTCSSFSAVGLFFGFLVSASLTKWWKLFVLLYKKKRKKRQHVRKCEQMSQKWGLKNKKQLGCVKVTLGNGVFSPLEFIF